MSSSNLNFDQAEVLAAEAQVAASVGALLSEARERAGLTSDELARRLCMTPSKLEALERDGFDSFPGATYVRGYIRNICKELGADEAQVLAAYAKQAPAEAPRAAQVPKGPVMSGSNTAGGSSAFSPLLLLVAVAAVAGYWWMGQQGEPAVPQAQVADVPEVRVGATTASDLESDSDLQGESGLESDPEPAQAYSVSSPEASVAEMAEDFEPETDVQLADVAIASVEAEESEPEAVVEPASELASQPVIETAETAEESVQESVREPVEVASEQQVEPEAPMAASGVALALSFAEESWVEVTDATGNKLIARLQPAGSTVELNGQAPFSLMLGNAAATTVSYAGEVVDSAPLGNRRTRKLTVGG
ncbi:RodZ domain-containing protein [Microbulbifer elongatus]|uniref:RodZ domain-containing protein n=1 Tax=Microbulbifer elongatus TaxID=86173 RepID=UPI001CFC8E7E|nr:RodZ domain-containing protein [Microbulbifer elongatus]